MCPRILIYHHLLASKITGFQTENKSQGCVHLYIWEHKYRTGWMRRKHPLRFPQYISTIRITQGISRTFTFKIFGKAVIKDKHKPEELELKKLFYHILTKTYSFYQISIIVIPGLIQLITYFLTCRCASAASRKSFQISSLAWSNAFFSSLVVLQAAVRLYSMHSIALVI